MKKAFVFLLIICALSIVYAQNHFMYLRGEKHYFEVSPNKLFVQFTENTDTESAKSILEQNTSFHYSSIVKTRFTGLYYVSFRDTDKTTIVELAKQLIDGNQILSTGIVFVNNRGEESAALTNQMIVRLKNENDYPVLLKSVEQYKIDSIRKDEYGNRKYLLNINYSSEKDALQISNELYETGLFEYAEPDMLLFIRYASGGPSTPPPSSPNDRYYPDQWGLKNTGQNGGTPGIDIKAEQAWAITTGNPNIKIAILDTGVDLNHPDLKNNLLPGYDAIGGNNNGSYEYVNESSAHGTACAGISTCLLKQTDFSPIGAEWHYDYTCACCGAVKYDFTHVISEKDTIVDGDNCRALILRRHWRGSSTIEKYIIKQEKGKIYYYFLKQFHLIYDFDAKVNDTVQFTFIHRKYDDNSPFYKDTLFSARYKIERIENSIHQTIKTFTTCLLDEKGIRNYEYTEKFGYKPEFLPVLDDRSHTADRMRLLRCYSDADFSFISSFWSILELPCDYSIPNNIKESKDKYNIRVYPNPFNDNIFVYANKGEYVKILDVSGKVVFCSELLDGINKISTTHLPEGIYVLRIQDKNHNIKSSKMIKI